MEGGSGMKDMPGMDGMDHGKAAPSRSEPKDGMEGMPMEGMDHGGAREPAPASSGTEEPPSECAALKTMDLKKVDPTVAAALRSRCASSADPGARNDMGDKPMEGSSSSSSFG